MSKIAMGPRTLLYPTPATLVGATVDGKPNFMTVAWRGVACSNPPMVAVVGRIEESHVSDSCLTDGKPDVAKIKPLIFTVYTARQYYGMGEVIAKAFNIGEELKTKA